MNAIKTICLAVMIIATGVASMDAITLPPTSVLSGVRQIIIYPKPSEAPTQPRTPVYNPFAAELTNLGVLLTADTDWGDATVTLYSLEGDYYQTTFDMADVSIMLPVNGNVGDSYTLTIAVENGLEYEGKFIL